MQRILGSALLAATLGLGPQAWAQAASTPAAKAGFSESKAPVTPDPQAAASSFSSRWPHIDVAEARRLHGRKGVVFVDGRSRSQWEQSRIPGALSLPLGEFHDRFPALDKALHKAKVLVIYCNGESCLMADQLAQRLSGLGLRNMAVFTAGFPAWVAAGAPLETPTKPAP